MEVITMVWGHGWNDWLWMGLGMLVLWGGLLAVVVFAVRAFAASSSGRRAPSPPNAQEILAQRFARGELSEDEFKLHRSVLERRAL